MIGRLVGQLIEKTPTQILLDVAGVGYEVEIPLTTFYTIGHLNEQVLLHTHLIVRDDAHLLYGFSSLEERELFRHLIRVNGVGPRLAITILSGIEAEAFAQSVHNNDVKSLVALPGVGKKTAERLIIEMRDRLPKPSASAGAAITMSGNDNLVDAETALINLGFKPQEASRALATIENPEDSVENLIKQALKNLT